MKFATTQPTDARLSRPYAFYDDGWNARCRGEAFVKAPDSSRDWRDGWKDCDEAQQPMGQQQ